MKYLHPYPLVGNYLINDYTNSKNMVSNYINHYDINKEIFHIWQTMKDNFGETPIKIGEKEMLYKTKDNSLIKLTYPNNNEISIEKIQKIYKDGIFQEISLFKGRYNLDLLKKLYLGD